jgi:hypothetical protein
MDELGRISECVIIVILKTYHEFVWFNIGFCLAFCLRLRLAVSTHADVPVLSSRFGRKGSCHANVVTKQNSKNPSRIPTSIVQQTPLSPPVSSLIYWSCGEANKRFG